MGAANKLLLQWDGEPVVRRAARAALDAGIDEVIVVVAENDEAMFGALRDLRVRIVANRNSAEGMASSIRAGIAAVSVARSGALLMLADMPLVGPRHILPLLEAFATATDEAIVVPRFHNRRGNPVLWGRAHFDELETLTGDAGARGLLARHADRVVRVEVPDDAILVDFDTPQDWSSLLARVAGSPQRC